MWSPPDVLAAAAVVAAFAIIAAATAALVRPVRLIARLATFPRLAYRVEAQGCFGILPPISILDGSRGRAPASRSKRRATGVKERPGLNGRALAALPDLLSNLIGVIRVDLIAVDVTFGFSDPADTGQVYGRLVPLERLCRNVSLRPDFTGARLEGRIDAAFSVTPAALLPPLIRFAWRAYGPRP